MRRGQGWFNDSHACRGDRFGRSAARGSALIVALFMLALAGAGAAALAELGREALVRARLDRDGVRAWFLAEEGLAETVAGFPVGTDFSAWLNGGAAAAPAEWHYAVEVRDDVDETPADPTSDANDRVLVRVTAYAAGVVRRRLEAVVGRASDPFFPAAATLLGGVRELTGDFRLDGRDGSVGSACTMAGSGRTRAGLSVAENASVPLVPHPEQITGSGPTPSLLQGPAPDLTPLTYDAGAVHRAPGMLGGALGTAGTPQFTVVDGDAVIDGNLTGAGILYVTGRLRIDGALSFSGVVAAAGGIEVPAAGNLDLCGALWAAGADALDVRGGGVAHASADAIRTAAGLAHLPARARVIAVRELF